MSRPIVYLDFIEIDLLDTVFTVHLYISTSIDLIVSISDIETAKQKYWQIQSDLQQS